MAYRARLLVLSALLFCISLSRASADNARFDLVGPKIDVRVTRNGVTLPIAAVPNLQPGDRLWVHPDLPSTQSVKYLLICVFLRGNTNPPPPEWFTRIETWDKKIKEEGTFITVPAEAQQALLFLAPETGGDFTTLRSAVQGRPGAFVRAQQDLTEAGFEEARIAKYIADIRRVPPSDPAELQKHSNLLARTLSLKPNDDCFKRPVDMQFTCLTQSGSQIVLDDGHGQTIAEALNGPTSDLINQASMTPMGGAGVYSAYVGAVVDLVHIMGSLHTAKYQYIPAISFPQAEQMNLRLNTPPSFHDPKSVLVIALPAIQSAVPPPLRAADANHVSCLIEPNVVLPVEGAPLVFTADFAHDVVLHLNTPPGAPAEPDIPLSADAYFGGLVPQQAQQHHIPLHDPEPLTPTTYEPGSYNHPSEPSLGTAPPPATHKETQTSGTEPVTLTGTIHGRWGFDEFTGPTLQLQQLPGSGWHIVSHDSATDANPSPTDLIAGHNTTLLLASTGTACVHTITAQTGDFKPGDSKQAMTIAFKPEPPPGTTPDADASLAKPDAPKALDQVLALTLPLAQAITPGDLHLAIQQYGQPKPDDISMRTFAEAATVSGVELHAGDKSMELAGSHLNEIDRLTLGDLVFTPALQVTDGAGNTLHLELPANAPAPPTHDGEKLTAKVLLHDGRTITVPLTVTAARPTLTMLSKSVHGATPAAPTTAATIGIANQDDLPLSATLTFTLKSPGTFPRNGQIEIETLDGTLRAVLTLAPSGGLQLQDPHTVVATLDPLRSFGPSAFGALRLRAVYPAATKPSKDVSSRPESAHSADAVERPASLSSTTGSAPTYSDWLPLATLVRLPTLSQLQCPADTTQSCTITGNDLFLLQAVATDPAFDNPVPVPDGYTGTTLTLPHPSATTVFLRLRDDPDSVVSAIFPAPPPPAVVTHIRHNSAAKAAPIAAPAAPSVTAPSNDAPVKQESPASNAPGSPTGPSL